MGDGVSVPVGGEVCKNVGTEWHREFGIGSSSESGSREVGTGKGGTENGVTVPVGSEVCKKVRGEWHREMAGFRVIKA
jgi:hypothetical protein